MRHHSTPFTAARTRLARMALCCIGVALAGCGGPRGSGRTVSTEVGPGSRAELVAELSQVRSEATLAPAEAYWPYREAAILSDLDSLARAESALDRALDVDPDYAPALSLLSKLDYDAGRHEQSIARLEQAATRGPLPTELQIALGLHYEAVGNFDASDSLFQRVHSDHNSVAYYALRSDDLERASAVATRSLERNPDSAATQNDFGITRLYAGDPLTARTHFLRALELDSHHLGALYNLAVVETYYLLDDGEGSSWFERYREAGGEDDPDGLVEHFADRSDRQAQR